MSTVQLRNKLDLTCGPAGCIIKSTQMWWNGIHSGLKIRRRKLEGSNPSICTNTPTATRLWGYWYK